MPRRTDPERVQAILQLALRDLTAPQIAHDLGMNPRAVRKIAHRHGIGIARMPRGARPALPKHQGVPAVGRLDPFGTDDPFDNQGE